MAALIPPLADKKAILEIARLDEKTFTSLLGVFSGEDSDSEELVEAIRKIAPALDNASVQNIVDSILNMHAEMSNRDMTPAEFADSTAKGLAKLTTIDDVQFSESELDLVEQRIGEILSKTGQKTIIQFAKAFRLARDCDKVFCNCRILTDIRPIFSDNAEEEPTLAAIIHTLRLGYHANGDHEEIYISLDSEDVTNLKNILTRAEMKAETLKKVLEKADIGYLDEA